MSDFGFKPDLHPTQTSVPGEYKSLGNKKTDHACGISDVIDFIFDYVSTVLVSLSFTQNSSDRI